MRGDISGLRRSGHRSREVPDASVLEGLNRALQLLFACAALPIKTEVSVLVSTSNRGSITEVTLSIDTRANTILDLHITTTRKHDTQIAPLLIERNSDDVAVLFGDKG